VSRLLGCRVARRSASVLAWVVLLCQATAWFHGATPHVTCLEHGESIHLQTDGRPSRASLYAGATAARESGLALAPVSMPTAAHEHEHCALQGHRVAPASAAKTTFTLATLTVAALPVEPAARGAVGLLRFAPKTSPPRTPVS
jgi:hypothetical protein